MKFAPTLFFIQFLCLLFFFFLSRPFLLPSIYVPLLITCISPTHTFYSLLPHVPIHLSWFTLCCRESWTTVILSSPPVGGVWLGPLRYLCHLYMPSPSIRRPCLDEPKGTCLCTWQWQCLQAYKGCVVFRLIGECTRRTTHVRRVFGLLTLLMISACFRVTYIKCHAKLHSPALRKRHVLCKNVLHTVLPLLCMTINYTGIIYTMFAVGLVTLSE